MTQIKLCGMTRQEDILAVNALQPEYIGFIFAKNRRRTLTHEQAAALRQLLFPSIQAVGVFLDNEPEEILSLTESGVIDMIQLHGQEDETFLRELRRKTSCPVIKAFVIRREEDLRLAERSSADHILLDGGTGDGKTFCWELLQAVSRPYFLAGGLNLENVTEAVRTLHPFAVDVSSGIETNGRKDIEKMTAFMAAVRKEGRQ